MCGSMLHKCTGVCCTKVREYVAQRYGSMLHKCAGVYCTNVREYIAQMCGSILHKLHIAQYKVKVGKSEGTAHLGDLDINGMGGH